ncbi:EAL domain-containing protein [Sphingomonas humi]|uniref:EAL domain-containing protein n=2 Tax=Sphingomonas humi TaxID=335630 RepID=A0ABP7RM92_9SPHN
MLPIALVVAMCLGAQASLFLALTSSQDRMALAGEHELASTALREEQDSLLRLLKDYAFWDSAYQRLSLRLDTAFADENLGLYLAPAHGLDYSFVLDGQDRTIYATRGTAKTTQTALTALGAPVVRAVSAVRRIGPGGDPRVVGFTLVEGHLALFGVSAILPSPDSKMRERPGPRALMILVDYVDAGMMHELANRYRLADLRLTGARPGSSANLPVTLYGGEVAGHLTWSPYQPGTNARHQLLPWMLAVGLVVIFLAIVAVRMGRASARELIASEAKARHLAHHDTLTLLPNRRAFMERLKLREESEQAGILYLDLDGFKEVNDVFGHGAGDALLKAATERLQSIVSWRGILARIGGDEFAVLITGPLAREGAECLAQAVVQAFDEPFETAGHNLSVGTSIGVVFDNGDLSGEEMVRRADIAMYVAKSEGKHRYRAYDPSMERGRELTKQLESDLHRAIGTDQIYVLFQPVVNAGDGRTIGVEALARWRHPDRGEISPDIFIPIAEKSGLIVALGRQILREACQHTRSTGLDLAVNLSPAQFWNDNLFEDITSILEETEFPTHRLELEITENYLLRRPEAAAQVLNRLRRIGIRVALDDFGTGYASVAYLKRFKMDKLKLDRSFVERIANDSEAASVASAMIALGQALNLNIAAEGVETEDQARALRIAGCTHLQGWLFGRPQASSTLMAEIPLSRRA